MSFGDNSFIPTCVPTQSQAREGVRAHKGSDPYKKKSLFCSVQKFRKTYIQPMSVKNQAHSMFYAIFSRVYITVLTMEVEIDCPDRQVFTRSGRSL